MNKRLSSLLGVVYAGLCFNTLSIAQGLPENVSLSGYAHSYYMYNFNSPLGGANDGRLYDNLNNQIGFSIFQFSLAYEDATTLGVLDLNFGPAAATVNGNAFGGTSDAIQNAYVVQKVSDKFSFEVGKFGTHIGYEVIDATANANYSTSYLFNYGPFYHVGARFRYQFNDTYSMMAAVYNNWDNLIDNNDAKTFGASFGFAPSEALSASLNWIGGPEGTITASGAQSDFRQMVDLVLSYQATEAIHLGFNGVYGTDTDSWFGAAGYFTYGFNENLSSTMRLEYFDDSNAIRGFGTTASAVTLSANYIMKGGHITIRPEIKADFTDSAIFTDQNGIVSKTNQTTMGLVVLYRF